MLYSKIAFLAFFLISVLLNQSMGISQTCGAQCVIRCLSRFSSEPIDSESIIAELKTDSMERYPSLKQVQHSLEQRSLSTVLVEWEAWKVLADEQTDHVAVLHVNSDHFAIDEGGQGMREVWWAPGVTLKLSWNDLDKVTSDVCLVVSRTDAEELKGRAKVAKGMVALHRSFHRFSMICGFLFIGAMALKLFRCRYCVRFARS